MARPRGRGSVPDLDRFGRPVIQDEARERIRQAFQGVDGRGALILVGDTQTKTMRGHVAAKLGDSWKVAAGGGFDWGTHEPFAEFVLVKTW